MCSSRAFPKRLGLDTSLHEILQILSLTMFETPLDQLLTVEAAPPISSNSPNQLNLFRTTDTLFIVIDGITCYPMRKCKNCLLPETVPGADIDVAGLCNFCRQQAVADTSESEAARQRYAVDLEKTLRTVHGEGEYDCLVNLSGGKDSCLLLYRIRNDYGLRVLAFTTDINHPDVARENIQRTIQKVVTSVALADNGLSCR
jgi:hypothetical protein